MGRQREKTEHATERAHGFGRVVVGVHRADEGGGAISAGVALAGLLRVDLQGFVLEDPALLTLAQMRGLREYRPCGRSWQALDLRSLTQALDLQAERFERRLREMAGDARIAVRFQRMRRTAREALATLSSESDVLVVAEPADPAERVGVAFGKFLDAAAGSSSPVLLVPRMVARTTGPVMALATTDTDPSVAIASELARLAREDLVVAPALPPRLSVGAGARSPYHAIAFPDVAERLVVAMRTEGATGEELLELATSRRVPLLLLVQPSGKRERRAA